MEKRMIEGTLVSIGAVVPEDFPTLFRWANDVEAARLNGAFRPVDWVSHAGWWESIGKDPGKVVFAVRKRGLGPIIGWVQILNINPVARCAEVGIRIGNEADRGHGYGRETLRLAIDYCWNHLNLHRLALIALHTNERAIRIYESLGFEQEGRLRDASFVAGRWVDIVVMGKLRPAELAG